MIAALLRKMVQNWIARQSKEPALLDHVPVNDLQHVSRDGKPSPAQVRREKLSWARARYGRAFKCAAKDQDREVMIVPGEFRKVGAGRLPTQQMIGSRGAVSVFERQRTRG